MKTTTILHEYQRRLAIRVARKEISASTAETYLNDASRVFEVLLTHIPVSAIQGYMQAAGYRADYTSVSDSLVALVREPGHSAFPSRKGRSSKAHVNPELQKQLPGV